MPEEGVDHPGEIQRKFVYGLTDNLTITRAQYNTEAQAHEAGDRAQLCLVYSGIDPADIVYDLLVTYASVPAAYITLADWQAETAKHGPRVVIAAPAALPTATRARFFPGEDRTKLADVQAEAARILDSL